MASILSMRGHLGWSEESRAGACATPAGWGLGCDLLLSLVGLVCGWSDENGLGGFLALGFLFGCGCGAKTASASVRKSGSFSRGMATWEERANWMAKRDSLECAALLQVNSPGLGGIAVKRWSGRGTLHPLVREGLAAYMLLRVKGFGVALQRQLVVPRPGETPVLLMQLDQVHEVVADDVAAPLLDAYVIIAVVVGVEVWAVWELKLEAHLRVPHGVAVLLAIVCDGDAKRPCGPVSFVTSITNSM